MYIHNPRAATADYLINEIHKAGISNDQNVICKFPDCVAAFVFACEQATKNDRICIFGSFYTVGDVLRYLNTLQSK